MNRLARIVVIFKRKTSFREVQKRPKNNPFGNEEIITLPYFSESRRS